LYPDRENLEMHAKYYKNKTRELIARNSVKQVLVAFRITCPADCVLSRFDNVPGTFIDVVADVLNPAAVHWACDYLCGISLKTPDNPNGEISEKQMYDYLAILFSCVFRNNVPYLVRLFHGHY
jgi:linoleate 10R-lipoxygenase